MLQEKHRKWIEVRNAIVDFEMLTWILIFSDNAILILIAVEFHFPMSLSEKEGEEVVDGSSSCSSIDVLAWKEQKNFPKHGEQWNYHLGELYVVSGYLD